MRNNYVVRAIISLVQMHMLRLKRFCKLHWKAIMFSLKKPKTNNIFKASPSMQCDFFPFQTLQRLFAIWHLWCHSVFCKSQLILKTVPNLLGCCCRPVKAPWSWCDKVFPPVSHAECFDSSLLIRMTGTFCIDLQWSWLVLWPYMMRIIYEMTILAWCYNHFFKG